MDSVHSVNNIIKIQIHHMQHISIRLRSAIFFLFPLFLLGTACKTEPVYPEIPDAGPEQLKNMEDAAEDALQYWHYKDILEDSVPGISLDKAYTTLLNHKKGNPVTVAVIDMEIAVEHEDLKANIWTNSDEIAANGKDDDNNGYTDDIHGWNFLGNLKGQNILFANYEYTRIIKKFDSVFKDKPINDIPLGLRNTFFTYKRAKEKYEKRMEYALEEKQQAGFYKRAYIEAMEALKDYFPNKNYTIEKVDSLKKLKTTDAALKNNLNFMSIYLEYELSEASIDDRKLKADARVDKLLNLKYNEREILGDNPEDITGTGYGTPVLNANTALLDHGTSVAGILAATRANATGARGITDNINIMPLCISPYGDEHDKDMALAIRYAVDNGAKIINISSSKEFSLHLDWVHNALKYAAVNDVLIVTSAGNDNYDLDKANTFNYPEDSVDDTEFVDNFIKVGATTHTKALKRSDSNYGKKHVDIFAPGVYIYTTSSKRGEKYTYFGGTSAAAPIVSGVAALIRSYYPELSAAEVKDIILQSGVSYTIEIEIEQEGTPKKIIPFSECSKSGKIVNAYNALLMAEKRAKKK